MHVLLKGRFPFKMHHAGRWAEHLRCCAILFVTSLVDETPNYFVVIVNLQSIPSIPE